MNDSTESGDLLPPSVDPNISKLGIRKVTGVNDGTMRTVSTVRTHTAITDEPHGDDTGPTPLETVLVGLVGCEGVIINRVAEAMGFKYSRIHIDCEGEVDQRGSRGVAGVRPYFNWVSLDIRIVSSESVDRLLKLRRNVESRCPVMNLLTDAGVEMRPKWKLTPEAIG